MEPSHESDDQRILRFLKSVEELIGQLLEDPQRYFLKVIAMNEELMRKCSAAWSVVRQRLRDCLVDVKKAGSQQWKMLDQHGMSGAELDFKINLFEFFRERFYADPAMRWLKRLLAQVNSMLGSLSSAFPGLEAVQEFKDALEAMLSQRSPNPSWMPELAVG